MSTILENSIWPNTDPDSPLGVIKVQIPDGINTLWPDGDALIGNVVYKNGLISGFVDTKALTLNKSGATTIPYDYVDIALDHSMENNLTINKGERCKYLNIKYTESSIVLPSGFTELDYLVASGTQYIITDVLPSATQRIEVTGATSGQAKIMCFVGAHSGAGHATRVQIFADAVPHEKTYRVNPNNITLHVPADTLTTSVIDMPRGIVWDNGAEAELPVSGAMPTVPYGLFARNRDAAMETQYNLVGCIARFRVYNAGTLSADFVPVLNAEGTPGMYDKVSETYLDNDGSGTFGYRIKRTGEEFEPKTFSLRDPYYIAPSGVYARKVGENKIEILADTEEATGDDWEHFVDTAEAYEHFGIISEEIEC